MQKIFLYLHSCGNMRVPKNWDLYERVKMQRLYYIKGGVGWYLLPNQARVPFEPGKMYLTPYNMTDSFLSDPKDPLDHIFFDFTSIPPIIGSEPICRSVPENSALRMQLGAIEAFFTNRNKPTAIFTSPLIQNFHGCFPNEEQQLLYLFLETLLVLLSCEKELPFMDDASVIETLEYIRQHYAEKLSIRSLAAHAGFETNYFIRRFKQMMGVTPYAYLHSFRLQKASDLISDGYTYQRAAEAVGYDNASSLSRAFKKFPT